MQNDHSFHLGQEELYLCDFRKIGFDQILTSLAFLIRDGTNI